MNLCNVSFSASSSSSMTKIKPKDGRTDGQTEDRHTHPISTISQCIFIYFLILLHVLANISGLKICLWLTKSPLHKIPKDKQQKLKKKKMYHIYKKETFKTLIKHIKHLTFNFCTIIKIIKKTQPLTFNIPHTVL